MSEHVGWPPELVTSTTPMTTMPLAPPPAPAESDRSGPAAWVVAMAGAVLGGVLFVPTITLLVGATGLDAERRSCTMEQASSCAISDAPSIIGSFLAIVFIVVAAIGLAALVGIALLLSVAFARNRPGKQPYVRAAIGGVLV